MKIDYVVVVSKFDEIICSTLTEARRKARILSNKYGDAFINRWVFDKDCGDMVFDEKFEIFYCNGRTQEGKQ